MLKDERFKTVFSEFRQNYIDILNVLYPSKNSTGFTERNLSVNFAKAYEQIVPTAHTWYEFQFGTKNNLHFDAIIVDAARMELLIIESKRFSNPTKKMQEVKDDIIRINKASTVYRSEFETRINGFEHYSIYGVVLADVWTENRNKIQIKNEFQNASILDAFSEESIISQEQLKSCLCFVESFENRTPYEWVNTDYFLLGLLWKVS